MYSGKNYAIINKNLLLLLIYSFLNNNSRNWCADRLTQDCFKNQLVGTLETCYRDQSSRKS